MKTSLIILTYNDGGRTYDLVSKIYGYRAFDDIILVNNASTDDTQSLLEKAQMLAPGKIHVICTAENGGYAKGNNFGALYALKNLDPDLIFIANPDTFFTEETVLAMKKAPGDGSQQAGIHPVELYSFIALCQASAIHGMKIWRVYAVHLIINSFGYMIFSGVPSFS